MPTQSFTITPVESGRTVLAVLCERLSLPGPEVKRLIRERHVWLNQAPCPSATWRVTRGQRLELRTRTVEPPLSELPEPILRFVDDWLVVVDKPAGLTTMRHPEDVAEFGRRGRRFLPPTLADLLPGLLARRQPGRSGRVRAVHRLDRDTSGLVVFARTPEAERHLGKQFRAHTIERRYLAMVRGRAQAGRIESYLIDDRGDGRRGSASQPGTGKRAVTHVAIMEELGDYTLVECRLETGRTHQVRIHLGESGTPLCGERVYDRPLHGKPLADDSGAPRLALHAARLGFEHPATGQRKLWSSPLQKDLAELLTQLRAKARIDS